jgi:hypothetical protein
VKQNRISIEIEKPVEQVYEYTINPINTPKWIEHLEVEETNEYPVKLGTIYRNHGASQVWDEYVVTNFKQNEIFELTSKDGTYHVCYTYKKVVQGKTEMEYYEWVDEGELTNPFTIDVLEKLKTIMEKD